MLSPASGPPSASVVLAWLARPSSMYEDYYGFVQPPFSLTPDPRFLYRSESHDVALQQVWQAIRRKEGFIVLTGDIGTGKTTLCRTLLEQFDQTTFTALILNPFLSVEELLREVLLSFGVVSKDALQDRPPGDGEQARAGPHAARLPAVARAAARQRRADHRRSAAPVGRRARRDSGALEPRDQRSEAAAGRASSDSSTCIDILHKPDLRQLDQRISIRCFLKALTREEVEAYVTHRLWVARGSTSVTFTPKAFDLVHSISGGVPRMINLLCDRALMVGVREADQPHRRRTRRARPRRSWGTRSRRARSRASDATPPPTARIVAAAADASAAADRDRRAHRPRRFWFARESARARSAPARPPRHARRLATLPRSPLALPAPAECRRPRRSRRRCPIRFRS